jgi:hypothetical protein
MWWSHIWLVKYGIDSLAEFNHLQWDQVFPGMLRLFVLELPGQSPRLGILEPIVPVIIRIEDKLKIWVTIRNCSN